MDITKIYLVENCYGDLNKVYIGKSVSTSHRKHNHKITYGREINFSIIDSIDSIDKKDWKPLECYWIEQFRQWGFKVMNKNKGGGGPSKYAPDIIAQIRVSNDPHYQKGSLRNRRISESNKESQKWSLERRLKHSIALQGRILGPCSDQRKEKISKANKGRVRSEETRAKLSQISLGRKRSEETKRKMRGRIRSEESKVKQSNSTKGRKITWDLRTKGKKISQEQKNKIGKGNSKQVFQYKDGILVGIYNSYTSAKLMTGIDPQQVLVNKSKSAGGYFWTYKKPFYD